VIMTMMMILMLMVSRR